MYVLTLPRRDFKLWTILQGNAYRVATFQNATCVMSHQSLSISLSISHSVCVCVCVCTCVCTCVWWGYVYVRVIYYHVSVS